MKIIIQIFLVISAVSFRRQEVFGGFGRDGSLFGMSFDCSEKG
jgi:hypothetical protein